VTAGPETTEQKAGMIDSARRVVAHATTLARLQRELATTELQRKGGTLGAGAAAGLCAVMLAVFALGFGLATVTAALALVVDWWLALLIVFLVLVLAVAALGLVARNLVRAGTPLKPEQALVEARLTKEALRRS
jgi:uncharacterized membrane protein YqjE